MAKVRLVNKYGTLTGWNNITVNVLGRDLEGIVGLEYGDSQDMANEYGAGDMPIGQSVSNYKPDTVKLELYDEEVTALQQQLPKGITLFKIPAFPIIAAYDYQGSLYRDVMNNCRIMKVSKPAKQGDGKLIRTLELLCSHITPNA